MLDLHFSQWPLMVLQQKKNLVCCVSSRPDVSVSNSLLDRSDWQKVMQVAETLLRMQKLKTALGEQLLKRTTETLKRKKDRL